MQKSIEEDIMSALTSVTSFPASPKLHGLNHLGQIAGFVVIAALALACLINVIEMVHTIGPVVDGAIRMISDPRSLVRF